MSRGDGRPTVACTAPPFLPDLHDDWPLQRHAMTALGMDATAVVWSDPTVQWGSYDLVVANGVWDHIHHQAAFLEWVDSVAGTQGVPMVNAPAILRWNLDKRYLRDLAAAGVAIVPTTWVEASGPEGLATPALPAGEIVVKPSVSGGGYQTARYEAHEHDAARAHVAALVASGRTAMVQPYQSAVDREGETGLIFLGGEFSHAVHKEPMIRRGTGPRDSLIENQVVSACSVDAAPLDLGRRALAAVGRELGPTTYARVDVVRDASGEPLLLELELLDPVLFLTTCPDAATTLARVLRTALNS